MYDHFLLCNTTVAEIQQKLAIVTKQAEVLQESLAYYIDARQNDIGLMVDAMRSRAHRRKDDALLLPFEKTIKYNGQIGNKAARTRRQNQANEEGAAPEPTPEAQPQVEGSPP